MAALSVLELPSKRLLNIPLPSEEGDMITMEKFLSILSKNCKDIFKYLMVGDRRINKEKDGSRPVRFFLLDNCPWYVHTFRHGDKSVRIVCGTDTRLVDLGECDTVLDVKEILERKLGVPVEQQVLAFYGGHSLHDSESTAIIHPDNLLNLNLRIRGGSATWGFSFANVTDKAGPVMLSGIARLQNGG